MKKPLRSVLFLALLVAGPLLVRAQVPPLLEYDGFLSGNITGNRTMGVKLYNASKNGTVLYSESIGTVKVTNGEFYFQYGQNGTLGNGTTPTGITATLPTGSEHWLAITVNGTEQSPRQRLLSVPFALRSGNSGNTVLSGTANPVTSLGNNGDFYINTAARTIFGPKTSGVWGNATALVGPQGPQGPAGAQGLPGRTILSGATAPANTLGANGDFYFNTANRTIFGPKTAGVWGNATTLVGPQGPKGDAGNAGPAGPAGVKGPAGAVGPQGPIGLTGPAGPKGTTGNTGPQGPQGLQGPAGNTGPAGATGPQGPKGDGTTFYAPYVSGAPTTQATPVAQFQGSVLAQGQPVNGNRTFTFKIFDAAVGGTQLYSETIGVVPVSNGVYSFEYGSGIGGSLAASIPTTSWWVEITMNGTVQPPRQKILAAPYALKAKKSEDTQALSSNFTILQTQTSGLSTNLTAVQGQVNGVSSNLTTLQTQTTGLASNVSQLQVATAPLTELTISSTLAGFDWEKYEQELDNGGTPELARVFGDVLGVALDGSGNVYVGDARNNLIKKISTNGSVTTLAGSGNATFADGQGTSASFAFPSGVAVDGSGNVYVADYENHRIRKISANGSVTTLAGSGNATFADGQGTSASFNRPGSLALDGSGNIYVADQNNHRIRKISANGSVTTLAGSGNATFADGNGALAGFNNPAGIAVDGSGNVYVAEYQGHRIRKITANGSVTTLAGSGNATIADGQGTSASFNCPLGVAVDGSGNVYVGDEGNKRIRKISPNRTVTTLYSSDLRISGVAFDGKGAVFFGEDGRIRKLNTQLQSIVATLDSVQGQVNEVSSNVTALASNVSALQGQTGNLSSNLTTLQTQTTGLASNVSQLQVATAPLTEQTVISTLAYYSTQNPYDYGFYTGIAVDQAGNVYVGIAGGNGLGGGNEGNFQGVQKITASGISKLAGSSTGDGAVDGNGTAASFSYPTGVALDGSGNVYVADLGNNRIRKITPSGNVTTLAGSGNATFADGQGTSASFNQPVGVAVDGSGNVYVAELEGHRIRKITTDGTVTTLAGSGNATFADGNGALASFNHPAGIAVDGSGNVYVADSYNHRIRKITADGTVTTLAGSGNEGFADGQGIAASFAYPLFLALDGSGYLYVTDSSNGRIRKITANGNVSTLESGLGSPYGISVDTNGTIYATDAENNRCIYKIQTKFQNIASNLGVAQGQLNSVSTSVTTLANQSAEHTASLAALLQTQGGGNLAAIQSPTELIQALVSLGILPAYEKTNVTTLAGSATQGVADGIGANAGFMGLSGATVDGRGNIYLSDAIGHRIRKVTPEGGVLTLAGSSTMGAADGNGTQATFAHPYGLAVDYSGTLYVADKTNNNIRKITAAGVVTTLAGSPTAGSADGTGANATFNQPSGVALDANGNLYVADSNNNLIRKITPSGVVSTLAGSGSTGSVDGTGGNASFTYPTAVAVDGSGNILVADAEGNRIRKVTPEGVVTTIAGSGAPGFLDAAGRSAAFKYPTGIAVDFWGNIYVADTNNNRIRKISPDGIVSTLAGAAGGYADSIGVTSKFNAPSAVAVDSSGTVYVADGSRLRKITQEPMPKRMVTVEGGILPQTSELAGTVVSDFQIGRFEVTWGEWQEVRAWAVNHGYTDLANVGSGTAANFPVTNVSWHDVLKWCNAKSEKEGLTPVYEASGAVYKTGESVPTLNSSSNGYRLPREKEWEWAARGGVNSQGYTYSGSNDVNAVAWNRDNSNGYSRAVGTKAANELGIYDMSGNAFEWCWDEYLSYRRARGGGFQHVDAANCSVGYRDYAYTPSNRALDLGFRLARSSVIVSTIAGSGNATFADGQGTEASFASPWGVAVDGSGNLYVADYNNNRIRKITANGTVTTLAGSGNETFADGNGTSASFRNPTGVAVDGGGNVFVADRFNNRIRKITATGVVTTLAGSGVGIFADGQGTSATFYNPFGVSVDGSGNVYVADFLNHRIRKITATGVVTTLAGSGYSAFADGNSTSASFNQPTRAAVDGSGNVYVADQHNHRIRKITATGVVTTLAGSGNSTFADGNGTSASFRYPTDVAVDGNGVLYVADTGNHRIRKITPSGVVTTLAGSGVAGYADGQEKEAIFNLPTSVALDSDGNLYVSDRGNNRIRKISLSKNPQPITTQTTYTVTLIRGVNSAGYGVNNNIIPDGASLSFSPLEAFGGLPVFAYVVIAGDTSITPWGLVGSITITDAYSNTPAMFKVIRNGKTYIFSSNSYQNKPKDFFGVGSPAGNYYILDDSTLQSP